MRTVLYSAVLCFIVVQSFKVYCCEVHCCAVWCGEVECMAVQISKVCGQQGLRLWSTQCWDGGRQRITGPNQASSGILSYQISDNELVTSSSPQAADIASIKVNNLWLLC